MPLPSSQIHVSTMVSHTECISTMIVRHADICRQRKGYVIYGENTAFFFVMIRSPSLYRNKSHFSLLTLSSSVFGIACGTQYDLSKRNAGSKRSITSMRSMGLDRAGLIG